MLFYLLSFTAKFESVFVSTLENAFSWGFHFKAKRKSIGSSKSTTRDFLNSPPFERSASFYVKISEHFEHFQDFNVETDFLVNESFFQKTGVSFFSYKCKD